MTEPLIRKVVWHVVQDPEHEDIEWALIYGKMEVLSKGAVQPYGHRSYYEPTLARISIWRRPLFDARPIRYDQRPSETYWSEAVDASPPLVLLRDPRRRLQDRPSLGQPVLNRLPFFVRILGIAVRHWRTTCPAARRLLLLALYAQLTNRFPPSLC